MAGKIKYEAVVIGTSSGGFQALSVLLSTISKRLNIAFLIVIHRNSSSEPFLAEFLDKKSEFNVKEAEDKELIKRGYVYIAPAGYHMIISRDKTINLSVSAHVNYSRPSIDPLFETAAEVYFESLIGIILTGANHDGSMGLKRIKELGGHTIVQSFEDAAMDTMPRSALKESGGVDKVVALKDLPEYLNSILEI